MGDGFMRHFISLLGAGVALLAYWAGYVAGQNGMWVLPKLTMGA